MVEVGHAESFDQPVGRRIPVRESQGDPKGVIIQTPVGEIVVTANGVACEAAFAFQAGFYRGSRERQHFHERNRRTTQSLDLAEEREVFVQGRERRVGIEQHKAHIELDIEPSQNAHGFQVLVDGGVLV